MGLVEDSCKLIRAIDNWFRKPLLLMSYSPIHHSPTLFYHINQPVRPIHLEISKLLTTIVLY
jgi:hypothetical protein